MGQLTVDDVKSLTPDQLKQTFHEGGLDHLKGQLDLTTKQILAIDGSPEFEQMLSGKYLKTKHIKTRGPRRSKQPL